MEKGGDMSSSSKSIVMSTEEAFRLLNLAASLLQANIKMYLQRRKYLKYLREHKAASKIQAVWKGYYTRNKDKRVQTFRMEFFIKVMQKNLEIHYKTHARNINQVLIQQTILFDVIENMLKSNDSVKPDSYKTTEESIYVREFSPSLESLITETSDQVSELIVPDSSIDRHLSQAHENLGEGFRNGGRKIAWESTATCVRENSDVLSIEDDTYMQMQSIDLPCDSGINIEAPFKSENNPALVDWPENELDDDETVIELAPIEMLRVDDTTLAKGDCDYFSIASQVLDEIVNIVVNEYSN